MPDLPLPLTFRAELIQLITESIHAGESCALVGVGSSGKSNIVRFLRERADAREHYFGPAARRLLWLMVDCNALDSYDEPGLFTAMIDSLSRAVVARTDLASIAPALDDLFKETASPGGAAFAYRNLHRAVEMVRAAGDFQLAFVLDDCDKLIQVGPPSLLRRLRALRDDFKYKLVYITVTRRELHRLRPHSPEFESFYEIIVVRSFAIGPYSDADARFMLDRLSARLPTPRPVDPAEARMLIQATGGHGGLLKAAFFATRAGEDALDPELVDILVNESSVMDECRKIWESIEEEDHAGLIEAVNGRPVAGEARASLMAKGLVHERTDESHAVFCPVFEAYVRQKAGLPAVRAVHEPPRQTEPRVEIYQGSRLVRIDGEEVQMTRAEFDLLCTLYEQRGREVRREDLLERVLAAETYEPSGLGATIDKVLDRAAAELKAKLEAHGFPHPIIVDVGGGTYIKSGKYGKLLVSRGLVYKDGGVGPLSPTTRGSIGFKPEKAPPAELDFNIWLGPAQEQPFHENLVHYRWHWFWDFGNGDIGNQGVHEIDRARWAIPGATLPKSVISLGGRLGFKDQGQTACTQVAIFDYGETQLIFEVRGLKSKPYMGKGVDNILHFEEGVVNGGQFHPKNGGDPEPVAKVEYKRGPGKGHFDNFISAIRSRKVEDLNADILEGHYSAALCHLANMSYRLGSQVPFSTKTKALAGNAAAEDALSRMEEHLAKEHNIKLEAEKLTVGRHLKVDSSGETIYGDAEANKLLTRNYRKPFAVPEKVS